MSKQSDERNKKMSAFTMRVELELMEQAKKKAGVVPISRIIRILLKKWLTGQIVIDYTDED